MTENGVRGGISRLFVKLQRIRVCTPRRDEKREGGRERKKEGERERKIEREKERER